MKPHEIPASATSRLISYSSASVDCLERRIGGENENNILGGVCEGCRIGWLARGGALEVVNTTTGERIAAWNFGVAVNDETASITCVCQFKYENSVRLVVAVELATCAGLLCVFDVCSSKVIQAIEVSQAHKITALETIHSVMSYHAPVHTMCDHLRRFCGIIAVGTQGGRIYIIDACLDGDHLTSDETTPTRLCFINPLTHDVLRKRDEALRRGEHLCFQFDDDCHRRGTFLYRKPDNSVIKSFDVDDVSITCLKYVKQAGTLAVGFNFGCFQLWRLSAPAIDYSSRCDPDMAPVTHMAYQEPENDPRSFCYLWVARGPLPSDPLDEWISTIQLYQMVYNRKSWTEEFGVYYEDMMSIGQRFDHMLTNSSGTACSRVLTCFTIEDPFSSHSQRLSNEDSFDEGFHGPDLGLCAFTWEAVADDPQARTTCHLALFDINRWYHAQMPGSLRFFNSGHEPCSFFSFYTLSGVMEACAPDCLLSLSIGPETVTKFSSSSVPPPELHAFPSSLSFNTCCLSETGVVHSKYLGLQRQVLSDMSLHGPVVLMNPQDIFNMAVFAGLLPRSMDQLATASLTQHQQREVILCVALEYGLLDFITHCCQQFTDTEFVHVGCTLRTLLDWAWSRVAQIKEHWNKLCTPLYDWSGLQPDSQTLQQLQNNHLQLCRLTSVIQCLSNHSTPTTDQGLQDLETKLSVVTLICQHFQLVLWFLSTGLLPEYPESQRSNSKFSFPIQSLSKSYSSRRQEIKKLHSSVDSDDILLIDGLVQQAGQALCNVWCKAGGNERYPPPGLYALLNLYLLEGVSVQLKHSIVMYLLIDLISLSTDEKFVEDLGKFCEAMGVGQKTPRLVQGFWLLDHKDFEEALAVLLDPLIDTELLPWQHRRILKAFLYQGQSSLALKYMRVKKPVMAEPEDVKLKLTILLANRLTSEAFHYQRVCRDPFSAEDILSHFFLGCQQTKTVDALLQLPMNELEEKYFINYLQESSEPGSKEILVMHYLQRARYVDAIRCNEQLKGHLVSEKDVRTRERLTARSAIVDCYSRVLPSVQRKLTYGGSQQFRKRSHLLRREVSRPKPLSTVVNKAKKSHVISHSSLIQSVLEKVHETKPQVAESPKGGAGALETGPFVCTPVTPRLTSRVRDVVDVVFPMVEKSPEAAPSVGLPAVRTDPEAASSLSPVKKSQAYSPGNNLGVAALKRRLVSFSEAHSLLESPVIKRISPARAQQTSIPQATPQSILKVRKAVRKPTSPTPTSEPSVKHVQITSVINSDVGLSTPPRFQRKKIAFAEPEFGAEFLTETKPAPCLLVTNSQPRSPQEPLDFGKPTFGAEFISEMGHDPSPPVTTRVSTSDRHIRFDLPSESSLEESPVKVQLNRSPYPYKLGDPNLPPLLAFEATEPKLNPPQFSSESEVEEENQVQSRKDNSAEEEAVQVAMSDDEVKEVNADNSQSHDEDIDVVVDEDITFHIHHTSRVDFDVDVEMAEADSHVTVETQSTSPSVMETEPVQVSSELSKSESGNKLQSVGEIGLAAGGQDGPIVAAGSQDGPIEEVQISGPQDGDANEPVELSEPLVFTQAGPQVENESPAPVPAANESLASMAAVCEATLSGVTPSSSHDAVSTVSSVSAVFIAEDEAGLTVGTSTQSLASTVSPVVSTQSLVSTVSPGVAGVEWTSTSCHMVTGSEEEDNLRQTSTSSPEKMDSLAVVIHSDDAMIPETSPTGSGTAPEQQEEAAAEADSVFKTPPQPTRQILVMTPPTSPESNQPSPPQGSKKKSTLAVSSSSQHEAVSARQSQREPSSPIHMVLRSRSPSPARISSHQEGRSPRRSSLQHGVEPHSPQLSKSTRSETSTEITGVKSSSPMKVKTRCTDSVGKDEVSRTPIRRTRIKKISESETSNPGQVSESVHKSVRQSTRRKGSSKSEGVAGAPSMDSVPVSPSRILRSSLHNPSTVDMESDQDVNLKSPSRRSLRNKTTDNSIVNLPQETLTKEGSNIRSPSRRSTSKTLEVSSSRKSAAGTGQKSTVRKPKLDKQETVDKTPEKSGTKSPVRTVRKSPGRKARSKPADDLITETPVLHNKSVVGKEASRVGVSPSRRSTRAHPVSEVTSEVTTTPSRTAKKTTRMTASTRSTEEVSGSSEVAPPRKSTVKKGTRRKKSRKGDDEMETIGDDDVFTFSEPTVVQSAPVTVDNQPLEPLFVFSPPITRTRSVASSVSTDKEQPAQRNTRQQEARTQKKAVTRSRKAILDIEEESSPNQSVISFISPGTQTDSQAPTRQRVVKLVPQRSMTLRGKPMKKKRSAKLY